VLQTLPGIDLNGGPSVDSNSYLMHASWISWGAKASWNLMNLVRLPGDMAAVDAQRDVHNQRALALATVVAMQVHIARARIGIQLSGFQAAKHYYEVQKEILEQTQIGMRLGKLSQQANVKEQFATLLARAKLALAYADLQGAHASYKTTLGRDLVYFRSQDDVPVPDLAARLRLEARENGHPLGTWVASIKTPK
jgi:hypothetical protein